MLAKSDSIRISRRYERPVKLGKEPHRSYSGKMMFRVDPEVHARAAKAAELAGKSLNQWAEETLSRAAGEPAA
nr:toxin-antitoxin system HicB family antitoxin [Rhizobium sullae]